MILVTGGAGYIGSHTVVELLQAGRDLVIFDNLSNSSVRVLERIEAIAGVRPRFVEGDIRDPGALTATFREFPITSVIHFAGLKAVGESVAEPLRYYDNNVVGSLRLCEAMAAAGVRRLVFSSSATVYGDPHTVPIREDFPLQATNPYGRTKLHIEEMLRDFARGDADWRIALLRYFNPVGAHPSGLIGEDPQGTPNNLMPFVSQVAIGRRDELGVFGNDYPTPDGTGVRDYIHVCDLAEGHLAALEALADREGCQVWNLGTGVGVSVLEVLAAWSAAVGRELPHRIAPRRSGDVAVSLADPAKARRELGWQAKRSLADMCRDHWAWQSANPLGYQR